ncbi:MAG: FliM/FliN family flagellar motor switch protein [Phycisphaerales bacterium]|nr:MAG: FliM/FliN family flagellar motor switch protein [Phycisphaerales bacterium]
MAIPQGDVRALSADTPTSQTTAPDAGETGEQTSSSTHTPTYAGQAGSHEPQIERILGISVPVAVMLAERDLPVDSILRITAGTIIEFEVPFDSELMLQVAGRTIGHGLAVRVGEVFGLRVAHIDTLEDRIDAMGGRQGASRAH